MPASICTAWPRACSRCRRSARIGPCESDLADAGVTLRVFEADFRPMRHAFIGGTERCYMKLLVDDASDRVLAVHMIGADAPEIVQSLAVALTAGATKAHFDAHDGRASHVGRGVRADAHAGAGA